MRGKSDTGEYRVALLLPGDADFSGRLKDDAVRYALEHRHLKLLDLPFLADDPPSFEEGRIDFDAAMLWLCSTDEWVNPLVDSGIPLISTSSEWPTDAIPRICVSSPDVSRKAIEHLISVGSERVVYIYFDIEANETKQLIASDFLKQAELLGIPAAVRKVDGFENAHFEDHAATLTDEMEESLKRLVQSLSPKTGILCENDYLGYHICRLAKEIDILVPTELAVLGKFNYRIALFSTPPLSSIPIGEGVGYEALSLLDAALTKGLEIPGFNVCAPSEVIWRESTGGGSMSAGYIKKACRLMEDGACEGISAADVARVLNMSPQGFSYQFKRALKIRPGEFIAKVKINAAKHDLATTSLTVSQVAQRCGYAHQSKFTRFFKNRVGCTPMQYRKRADST